MASRNEVIRAANYVGLHVATWSPGDGATRYRFFEEPNAYNGPAEPIVTTLGAKDAKLFIKGYRYGRQMGLKLASEVD